MEVQRLSDQSNTQTHTDTQRKHVIDVRLRGHTAPLMVEKEKRNISHSKLFVIDLVSCLWL